MDKVHITNSNDLAQFCAEAAHEKYITIDTEFVREHTYYPKLCLVQIGLAQKAAVIDPLGEGMDLSLLFELLSNPKVLKIFHAARQDLEIFYILMGQMVQPVYDTQIAEMALGQNEQISYHALVLKYLGIDLDKGSRMSYWDKRPLRVAQLEYAFNDVIPLYQIYALQKQALREREEWISEMMERLCDPEGLVWSPDNAWKMLKHRRLKSKQLGTLKVVAAWRERTAQQKNLPRKWVMSDESVLALAQSMPKNLQEAQSLRLKPKNIPNMDKLLRDMQKAEKIVLEHVPRISPRLVNEDLLHLLRLALRSCAREHDFASRLLCSGDELVALAAMRPHSQEWNTHILQQGWRREIFGRIAEQIASGVVTLRFREDKLHFEEV